MHHDSGNIYTIHFSFFMIQFLPPSQKIMIPKQVLFPQLRNKNKPFLMRWVSCFFIKTVMLLLSWHKILFSNLFFSYVIFLSVHWYNTEDCFTIAEYCCKSLLLRTTLLQPMYYTKHRFSLIVLFAFFSFCSVDLYHLLRWKLFATAIGLYQKFFWTKLYIFTEQYDANDTGE